MENSETRTRRRPLPLSVILEGKSLTLTVLLQATVAILMIAIYFEGYRLFLQSETHVFGQLSDAAGIFDGGFLQYSVCLVFGFTISALAFAALALNFRQVHSTSWKRRYCCSICSLFFINWILVICTTSSVYLIVYAMTSEEPKEFKLFMLAFTGPIFLGTCLTCIANFLFSREFGCCLCCCSKSRIDRMIYDSQRWASASDVPIAPVAQSSVIRDERIETDKTTATVELSNQYETCLPGPSTVIHSYEHCQTRDVRTGPTNGIPESKADDIQCCNGRTLVELSAVHSEVPNPSDRASTSNAESKLPQEEPAIDHVVPEGSRLERSLRPDLSQTIRNYYNGGEQPVLSLFGFSKSSMKKLWSAVKEEPDHFRYAVWVKSAFITSIVFLIYACLKSLTFIFLLVRKYTQNRDEISNHMNDLKESLSEVEWPDGIEGISWHTVTRLCSLVDKLIMDYEWTACIGYPIGTLCGFCSVVAVLVQNKRMSLAVMNHLDHYRSQVEGNGLINSQWTELRKKFPMLQACMFLAIVSSTAVLQAQIIAAIISVLLGMLWNIQELGILLDLFGPPILAYLLVLIIDVVIMRLLKTSLTSDSEDGIKHPVWFNFFMTILSTVHLVLGLLYALWRLIYLTVTTVFVLNRLEVSLFTFGKPLDSGHNVFMSMLVLTVLIQQDKKQYVAVSRI